MNKVKSEYELSFLLETIQIIGYRPNGPILTLPRCRIFLPAYIRRWVNGNIRGYPYSGSGFREKRGLL